MASTTNSSRSSSIVSGIEDILKKEIGSLGAALNSVGVDHKEEKIDASVALKSDIAPNIVSKGAKGR